MKKLLSICALIFSITIMAQQEKVGENRNGTYIITNNLDLLKPAWDKLAKQKVINYTIHSKTNENTEVYYLSANSEDNQMKISIVLELVNNVFL